MEASEIPVDWTKVERWVWDHIAAGKVANLNDHGSRTPRSEPLDPESEDGWGEDRRVRAKFLQTILTKKEFVDATPYHGVRLSGALVVDGPFDLQAARLQRQFWLEKSRVLTELEWQELRVDGQLSLEGSFIAAGVTLTEARIRGSMMVTAGIFAKDVCLKGSTVEGVADLRDGAIFKGRLDLSSARIGSNLALDGSTFEKEVNLNGATVEGSTFLRSATFKGQLDLMVNKIGSTLEMDRSTFEKDVTLDSATVEGVAYLRDGAIFKGRLELSNAKIGSILSMAGSTFEKDVILDNVIVQGSAYLRDGAIFKGRLDLTSARIGSNLALDGSTFEKDVSLNAASVEGAAILRRDETHCRDTSFKGKLDLAGINIGIVLDMTGSSFDNEVILYGATVEGSANLCGGATFKGELTLSGAKIGSTLNMAGSTFKGRLDLTSARIGSNLEMDSSTFEKDVTLNGATVEGSAFLRGDAMFKGPVDLKAERIGSNLEIWGSTFESAVDLTQCAVKGGLLLGREKCSSTRWGDSASLTLRNTHVGMFQDWWRDERVNAWPKCYELEGFTYGRLGWGSGEKETDMLNRPVKGYKQWLSGDRSSSPQPYEQLADRFRAAGEQDTANDILYEARERRRRQAWSKVDDYGREKLREWPRALGLWALRVTIGYGLGTRYFRVLWWVLGLTLLGAFMLIFAGAASPQQWQEVLVDFFASLDQLLPIVTLDKAHDDLIFREAQPYGVRIYFYAHKIVGWIIGSFLVSGLAGLTQRN